MSEPAEPGAPGLLLNVANAGKTYAGNRAVWQASLSLAHGEILVLLGPSGSGKSTLLKLIAGFEALETGKIQLDGRDIGALPPEKRGIGMVFQDYALFPHMTALRNVVFAAHRHSRKNREKVAMQYLEMLGMGGFAQRLPHQLSGGQQQRVAVARTFASAPRLMLLDEPFSSVDESMRAHARQEIRAILRQSGLGVIMVTHDCTEALSFADRICILDKGEVIQTAAPEDIYLRPANAFVAGFMGQTNLFSADIRDGRARFALGVHALNGACHVSANSVRISIRPEELAVKTGVDGGVPNGVVERSEFRGDCYFHTIRVGEQPCIVQGAVAQPLRPGEKVLVHPRSRDSIVVLSQSPPPRQHPAIRITRGTG